MDLNIREYIPGDEDHIVRLHRDVFNSQRTLDHWRWQFKLHSQGESWITLAETDKEIVAQYCTIRNHLNFMGREIIAGQTCDTMVRADQRGKQINTRLAERNYCFAAQKGAMAVFGFPNRNSYPGAVRSLNWDRILVLHYYFLRLGYAAIWGVGLDQIYKYFQGLLHRMKFVASRLRKKESEIFVSNHLPHDVEDLLTEIRNYDVLSVWKDFAYLRWRYQNHPEFQYKFHILKVTGRTEGLIVTRDCGHRIAICEVIHRNKNVLETKIFLYQVILHYQFSGAQIIDFYGYDNGFFDAIFDACKFNKLSYSNFVFVGRVFAGKRLEKMFPAAQNWTIVYGDTDLV